MEKHGMTVSYTHLDVYKRQIVGLFTLQPLSKIQQHSGTLSYVIMSLHIKNSVTRSTPRPDVVVILSWIL